MRSGWAFASLVALAAVGLPCQSAKGWRAQTPAERGTPPATAVRPNAADFVVHLTPPVDPARVTVMYRLLNDRGAGAGSYAVRDARVRIAPATIAIDTTLEGRMAHAIAAVIYVRGFRFAFVDEPSLANRRTATLTLVPLATVPLGGRVLDGDRPPVVPPVLEIDYDASGMVQAFEDRAARRFSEVGGGSFASTTTPVATATVAATGAFVADVPDFLADPAVAATPGALSIVALHGTHLKRASGPAAPGPVGLPLARRYGPVELRIAP